MCASICWIGIIVTVAIRATTGLSAADIQWNEETDQAVHVRVVLLRWRCIILNDQMALKLLAELQLGKL